jgi:hypothetical protein
MSGGPMREREVLLPILVQSRTPLLNHIQWEIKLYAMSNLAKLYTTQFSIIWNGTYFQMIFHANYHQIEFCELLQFKFKLLSVNSAQLVFHSYKGHLVPRFKCARSPWPTQPGIYCPRFR